VSAKSELLFIILMKTKISH